MLFRKAFLSALAIAGAAFAQANLAQAQDMAGGASYAVETTAKPGCRAVVLHIVREGGELSGVVFFKDGSGVSTVKGSTDGHTLQWTMTPASGNGPSGQVTGQVSSAGSLTARLAGTNCTLETTVPQFRDYSVGNG